MSKLQLSFHTTFAFRKSEVARLLTLAGGPDGIPSTIQELMAETGFGTKKVGPVKSWAARAGLISGNALTEEGRIIFAADPFLRSSATEWLMHFNLSFGSKGFATTPSRAAEWGGWPYFVFEFLPDHREFTLDFLVASAERVFEDTPKLLRANFPYLLRAYTDPEGLGRCGFLKASANGAFRAGESEIPILTLAAYLLTKLWARDFGETHSVLTDAILDQRMGLAPLLGISRSESQDLLDRLAGEGYVEQRRTVAPFQVVRRWPNPSELLKAIFG